MADLQKAIMVLMVAGLIGYAGVTMLVDIEYLSQSPTTAGKVDKANVADSQIEAIMAGEDPTDVLEPTAAGKKLSYMCDAGYIAGDMEKNRYSKISYASLSQNGITYIQISRYSPTYLVQESYQTVSATEVDDIPEDVKKMLSARINNPSSCSQQDLYLSSIEQLK